MFNLKTLFLIGVIVFILTYAFHFFGFFKSKKIKDIKDNVNDAVKFKGYNIVETSSLEEEENNINLLSQMETDKSKNSHFILYRSSGSGKTHFIKKYLQNKEKITIFCLDKEEWLDQKYVFSKEDLHQLSNITQFKNNTRVFG